MATSRGIVWGDYDQDLRAKQAAAVQAALRGAAPVPTQGQMVGNRYVGPHWAQQLDALMGQAMAGYTAGRGVEAEESARKRAQDDYTKLVGELTAPPQQVEQAGPQPAEFEGQPLMAEQAMPRAQRLEKALKLAQNPYGKEVGTMMVKELMVDQPMREQKAKDAVDLKRTRAPETIKLPGEGIFQFDPETMTATQIMDTAGKAIGMLGKSVPKPTYHYSTSDAGDVTMINPETGETKVFKGAGKSKTQPQGGSSFTFIQDDKGNVTAVDKKDPTKKVDVGEIGKTKGKGGGAGEGGKNLPPALQKVWITNDAGEKRANEVMDLIVGEGGKIKPEARSAMGVQHAIPGSSFVTARSDPKGVPIRAAIAELGNMQISDLSGKTVTAKEWPRLKQHIPTPSDTPEEARDKIKLFQKEVKRMKQEVLDMATAQGYKSPQPKKPQVIQLPTGQVIEEIDED